MIEERIREGFLKRDLKIEELENEILGIKTALIGAGFLTEEGLSLHTSYDRSKNSREDSDSSLIQKDERKR